MLFKGSKIMYHMKALNMALNTPLLEIISWHTHIICEEIAVFILFLISSKGYFDWPWSFIWDFPNTLHQKSYFFWLYIILHSLIIFETKIKQCATCETFCNFCSFLCTLTRLYLNSWCSNYFLLLCFQGCTFPSNLWDCRLLESRDYALSTSRTLFKTHEIETP